MVTFLGFKNHTHPYFFLNTQETLINNTVVKIKEGFLCSQFYNVSFQINMSDLIYIIIDGTQIAASKENLMTNSKYFEAMFQDHFLETNKKSVEIHSVKIDAFQVILEWTKERMMNRDLQNN